VSAEDRGYCISLIQEAVEMGARKIKACEILDVGIRTIERWEKSPFDMRRGAKSKPSNALSKEERAKVLEIANSREYANLHQVRLFQSLQIKGNILQVRVVFIVY